MFHYHVKGERRKIHRKNPRRKGGRFTNPWKTWGSGHRKNPTRKRRGRRKKG